MTRMNDLHVRLPADAVIDPAKLRFLLIYQCRNDKSAFLARGGYVLATAGALLADLQSLLSNLAVPLAWGPYGQYYEIRAALAGPSGDVLQVRTLWMTEHLSGRTKFITINPDRESAI